MLYPHSPAHLWIFRNFSRKTIVTDEIWLPAHICVFLHQTQSIGKGDLQEQEEEGGGRGFLTENKQLGLSWLRGQHGHLLAGHQGSEV